MSAVYANSPNVILKHQKYLDMIQWAEIDPSVKLTKAIACSINKGVLDKRGVAQPPPARIFVNDSLMLLISRLLMTMALAALIEEILFVMGKPDTAI